LTRLRKLGWFLALWVVGVSAVGIVALLVRLALPG